MTPQEEHAVTFLKSINALTRPGMPTFVEFVQHWVPASFSSMLARMDGGKQGATMSATLQLMYSLLIVLKSGDVTFQVAPELIQALRDTEIPEFPTSMLQTPFEGIRIHVPKGTFADPADIVEDVLVSNVLGDRFRTLFNTEDITHFGNILCGAEQTIKQAIGTSKELMEELPEELAEDMTRLAAYENFYESDVFRFAANLVLYIMCPDADMYQDKTKQHAIHKKLQGMKGGRRRDVLLAALEREKTRKSYIVGAHFRLAQEYTAKLTDAGSKWVLKHRVRVRGHWRNQPCGKGNEDTRNIFIKPHWRGPTYAEMVEKGYVVH